MFEVEQKLSRMAVTLQKASKQFSKIAILH
jgi:hypothetical protein